MDKKDNLKLPSSELGKELLKRRIGINLSQRAMADKIGISYPVYAGLERGTYKLSLKLLVKVADFLDMEVKEAFEKYASSQ